MSEVTKTVKRKRLFGWSTNFDYTMEEGVLTVWFYPDPNTTIKIELTPESTDMLRAILKQILNWMEQEITLSGTVIEKYEKRLVTEEAKTVEKWIKVL